MTDLNETVDSSTASTTPTSTEYDDAIFYFILQDLAEHWLNHERPRSLHLLHERHFKKIADNITNKTGVKLASRTLRNYLKDRSQNRQRLDHLGAAWLVEMGYHGSDEMRPPSGRINGRFGECVARFRARNQMFYALYGQPEGQTLEYKDFVTHADHFAVPMSAFLNSGDGGTLLVGVAGKPSVRVIGLTGDEILGRKARAALRHIGNVKLNFDAGWIYLHDEDKRLFFITVSPHPEQHTRVLASGRAYIRRGSSNLPMDAIGSGHGPECKVSEARDKLLKNLRHVLAAADETASNAQDVISPLVLIFLAESLATYIIDLMTEIHRAHVPGLNVDLDNTIEHRVELLRRGDVDAFLAGMKSSTPALHDALSAAKPSLSHLFQVARIWRRNAGKVDELFVAITKSGDLHAQQLVSPGDLKSLARQVHGLTAKLDSAANAYYELEELTVEDLSASAWL
jgi:hypothetical protein